MVAVRIVVFAAGAIVVLATLGSAVRTFLVPRAIPSRIARVIFLVVRHVFRLWAGRNASYERRDRVMAYYAPISLMTLLGIWLALVLAGYAAIFWALGTGSVRESIMLSGSSLLTLGFAVRDDPPELALTFTEAAIGLGLLALLIAYLPTLYASFSRREREVEKLEVRAGSPPTGVRLLELSWIVGHHEQLRDVWQSWEDWFAAVEESHTSYPALCFFRSPRPEYSWVTAAGAILDGASLRASSVDAPRHPEAEFMIRAGYLCLRHIADFFRIAYDPDPAPTDPVSITREEYDAAYERLAAAGVPMKQDRDQAWRDFAGWRVNYDTVLVDLSRLTMAPQAPWSSDRIPDRHVVPPFFRRAAGSRRAPRSG